MIVDVEIKNKILYFSYFDGKQRVTLSYNVEFIPDNEIEHHKKVMKYMFYKIYSDAFYAGKQHIKLQIDEAMDDIKW